MRLIFSLALILLSHPAMAFDEQSIPDSLKEWIPWVDNNESSCPYLNGQGENKKCAWSGPLEMDLSATGGSFSQEWTVYADSQITLPGNAKNWPQLVKINEQDAVVLEIEGIPSVDLEAGAYTVKGNFVWQRLPDSLAVPTQTGLVELTVNDTRTDKPQRGSDGSVYLAREEVIVHQEDHLDMKVHRKIEDDIPLNLDTHLLLHVSGKNRELELKSFLPEGFIPLTLKSELPALADAQGNLKIQLRAGTWSVHLIAFRESPTQTILVPTVASPWPQEEVWVYEAHTNLRQADVAGLSIVDPEQTTLPSNWKSYPAFRAQRSETLEFTERGRGMPEGRADHLSLVRSLWLDFGGQGLTVHDKITGTLNRGQRLEMNPPYSLEHAAFDGRDQLVTRVAGKSGLEIREKNLSVEADSRVEKRKAQMTVLGWNHDFESVSGVLHLPPGWKLFAAFGVDAARPSWIGRWTLLDFFLVLVTVLASFKLWGWKTGLLAFGALTLTVTEADAPKWIWLAVLAGESLARLIKSQGAVRFIRAYRASVLLIIVLMSLPFAIAQVRIGLHPILEKPWVILGAPVADNFSDDVTMAGASPPEPMVMAREEAMDEAIDEAPRPEKYFKSSKQVILNKPMQQLMQIDPKALVQTGPGLPKWDWNQVNLSWSGPVARDQAMNFWLMPPWMTGGLNMLRVALLAAFLFMTMRSLGGGIILSRKIILPLLVLMMTSSGVYAADYPPKELLDELQTKMTELPSCHPDCASYSHVVLENAQDILTVRLEAMTGDMTALPLPLATDWQPRHVLVDGQSGSPLYRDASGVVWMALTQGVHQITLSGPLPSGKSISLSFPLKPRQVFNKLSGWTVTGVGDNFIPEESLTLTPEGVVAATTDEPDEFSVSGQFAPFVRVERTLTFGLTWDVKTVVRRMSPLGTPISLQIPVIPGESATSDVRIEGAKVLVNMGPQTDMFVWTSVLATTDALVLKATESSNWFEIWNLAVSPIWHVEATGLPRISSDENLTFRPWPGEEIAMAITRPEGVKGQTLTIDSVDLVSSPGLRATDTRLKLALKSSLGGQHLIGLPKKSELISFNVDGQDQPLVLDDARVRVPLTPGKHEVNLSWRENHGIQFLFAAAPINLGAPSVNVTNKIVVPENRWVLWTSGAGYGPAVLFWSYLIVLVVLSVALARSRYSFLKEYHWILLGLGLTQVDAVQAVFVVAWFLAIGWRKSSTEEVARWIFNLRQILLVTLTLIAFVFLFESIRNGLLGSPDMQILGNGSDSSQLIHFLDRSSAQIDQPRLISVPLFAYRILMLAWALWLAQALLKWLKIGWQAFTQGGAWKKRQRIVKATQV